jgi:hypothetical protein
LDDGFLIYLKTKLLRSKNKPSRLNQSRVRHSGSGETISNQKNSLKPFLAVIAMNLSVEEERPGFWLTDEHAIQGGGLKLDGK